MGFSEKQPLLYQRRHSRSSRRMLAPSQLNRQRRSSRILAAQISSSKACHTCDHGDGSNNGWSLFGAVAGLAAFFLDPCLFNSSTSHSCNKTTDFPENPLIYMTDKNIENGLVKQALDTTERLAALRKLMKERDLDVYIVPSEDDHQSEYTGAADQRRAFISGFTGSAGIAVITQDECGLATDGRYFLQAASQLDHNWTLLKQGLPDSITWQQFAISRALNKSRELGSRRASIIAIDPKLISNNTAVQLQKEIKLNLEKVNLKCSSSSSLNVILKGIDDNLIDLIWSNFEPKPIRSLSKIKIQSIKYTGVSHISKIKTLQNFLNAKNSKGFIVSSLDEIAWLLNLRGINDIVYNPVFFAWLIVLKDKVIFYINNEKLTIEIIDYLNQIDGFKIKKYDEFWNDLLIYNSKSTTILNDDKNKNKNKNKNKQSKLNDIDFEELVKDNANNIFDDSSNNRYLSSLDASWAIVSKIGSENINLIQSPIEKRKGRKNETEIKAMKEAQLKDGVAHIRFWSWLEYQLQHGSKITEYEAVEKSREFRSQMDDWIGDSYGIISSSGSNAAIIHYAPTVDNCRLINVNEIYLNDSGSQFLQGTTDNTRTFHFGTPKQEEIDAYTRVLKGHIAVANIIFPIGVNGYMLDILERQYLWHEGLDYLHGSGHGVGQYLNVHEGPIGIGFRESFLNQPFQVGNILSNEPGFYKDGEFGIRIENEILVVEKKTNHQFDGRKFLGFETITLEPLYRKLINVDLLTKVEIDWINNYHKKVYDSTVSWFDSNELALEWLKRETKPIII